MFGMEDVCTRCCSNTFEDGAKRVIDDIDTPRENGTRKVEYLSGWQKKSPAMENLPLAIYDPYPTGTTTDTNHLFALWGL